MIVMDPRGEAPSDAETLVDADIRFGLTDANGRPTRPDPALFAPFDRLIAPDGRPW